MKALTYLLIAVVGLAFAVGIMGCKACQPGDEPGMGEPVQEPDYVCEVCGEEFATEAELEEHSGTHGP